MLSGDSFLENDVLYSANFAGPLKIICMRQCLRQLLEKGLPFTFTEGHIPTDELSSNQNTSI